MRTTVVVAFCAACLFAGAGTPTWPAAWLWTAEMYVCALAIGFWLAKHSPRLLAQRLAPLIQACQPSWDKVFMTAVMPLFGGWLLLMGWDAGRHAAAFPLWTQILGALVFVGSFWPVHLSFRENAFAAPVVKIQPEQEVIRTGPYSLVRHPMYAGVLFFFLGAPLQLGSVYGLAAVPWLVAVLAARIVMEERLLKAQLPGYVAYTKQVRYRLIPGVW